MVTDAFTYAWTCDLRIFPTDVKTPFPKLSYLGNLQTVSAGAPFQLSAAMPSIVGSKTSNDTASLPKPRQELTICPHHGSNQQHFVLQLNVQTIMVSRLGNLKNFLPLQYNLM